MNPYHVNFPQLSSNPPEAPTHGPCDGCGEIHDNDDLTKTGPAGNRRWLCDDCLEKESEKP